MDDKKVGLDRTETKPRTRRFAETVTETPERRCKDMTETCQRQQHRLARR